MAPSNTAAVLVEKMAPKLEVKEVAYPSIKPVSVIVKAKASALNPVDYMIQASDPFHLSYPTIMGVDVAGEIVEVGEEVKGLKVGDRVLAHAGYFGNPNISGTFQQYVLATASTTIPIPDSMSFTDASVLPLSVSTSGAALYEKNHLGLAYPSNEVTKRSDEVVFIWGGSSSVGSSGIQLAKASGYEVYTTAGKHNHDKVAELGADKIFDHSSDSLLEDVKAALEGKKLVGVYDTISKDETIASNSKIAKHGGLDQIVGVLPGQKSQEEGIEYKAVFGASPQENELGPVLYANFLKEALAKGTFLARPKPEVVGHGLDSVQKGLDILKGGVSAKKLVVTQ